MAAVLISMMSGLIAAVCAFALIAFIGAAFIPSESGYGFGLVFCPLGALTFFIVFRKIRASSR